MDVKTQKRGGMIDDLPHPPGTCGDCDRYRQRAEDLADYRAALARQEREGRAWALARIQEAMA